MDSVWELREAKVQNYAQSVAHNQNLKDKNMPDDNEMMEDREDHRTPRRRRREQGAALGRFRELLCQIFSEHMDRLRPRPTLPAFMFPSSADKVAAQRKLCRTVGRGNAGEY